MLQKLLRIQQYLLLSCIYTGNVAPKSSKTYGSSTATWIANRISRPLYFQVLQASVKAVLDRLEHFGTNNAFTYPIVFFKSADC